MRSRCLRTASLFGTTLIIVAPILVAVVALSVVVHGPITVHASTIGNTDQYEAGDCLSSPIWGGTSYCVSQRYGCTNLSAEDTVSNLTPSWTQTCLNQGYGWNHWHHGIDIQMPSLTQLNAVTSGIIDIVPGSSCTNLGIYAQTDLSGHVIFYLHGTAAPNTAVGQNVVVGTYVVSSDSVVPCGGSCIPAGNCPHLHLEVHSSRASLSGNGQWDDINPEAWLQYQGPHAATVSWSSNRIDLIVRGTNGDAWHGYINSGSWSGWSQWLGTPSCPLQPPPTCVVPWSQQILFAGQLAASTWGGTDIDVFGVGTDGNLWHRHTDDGSNWGATWENLGIPLNGPSSLVGTPAAASWNSNRISVFVRGVDGSTQHKYYSGGGSSGWTWDASFDGYSITDPSQISSGTNLLDLFVLGDTAHAGHAYHRSWMSGGSWSGWQDWGAANNGSNFAAQPTAANFGTTSVDAFANSADGNLYTKHSDGTNWGGWQLAGNDGGFLDGAPAAAEFAVLTSYDTAAFARGADAAAHMCWWGVGACGWAREGGILTNDPAAISNPQQVDFFVRGAGGSPPSFELWHISWTTSNGWSAWQDLGGLVT